MWEKRVVPPGFFSATIRVFSGIFSYRFYKPETAFVICSRNWKLRKIPFLRQYQAAIVTGGMTIVVDRNVVFKSILYFVFWANNIALSAADACSIFKTRRREFSGKVLAEIKKNVFCPPFRTPTSVTHKRHPGHLTTVTTSCVFKKKTVNVVQDNPPRSPWRFVVLKTFISAFTTRKSGLTTGRFDATYM